MVQERNEIINSYYNEWWENSDDIRNIIFDRLSDLVISRLPNGYKKSALDIGLGKGKISYPLLKKGYNTISIDINREFCKKFYKDNQPYAKTICGDITKLNLEELSSMIGIKKFDIVTCIEVIPIIENNSIERLIRNISKITDKLVINISNTNSLHGKWIRYKGFKNSFIQMDDIDSFRNLVESYGFKSVYERGVGLFTPISAFPKFKGKIIPIWLSKITKDMDTIFPQFCHLYYYEFEK